MDDPAVPNAISMFHYSTKDIGNSLNAPMGMPRKTLEEMFWIIRPEIVEEEEWVELSHVIVSEGPFKVNPGSLNGRPALPHLFNFSSRSHRFYTPPKDSRTFPVAAHAIFYISIDTDIFLWLYRSCK
jgi:hypothetical protein